MVEVKKARIGDFEAIYQLLRVMDPRIAKDAWQRIFDTTWSGGEDYSGYYLFDEGRVVGFLGYIFSSREINGRIEKFCNMSTWDVEEKYRSHSLSLLYPFLRLEGCTLTNFSASGRVNEILKKLGFKTLENMSVIIYPDPFAGIFGRKKASLVFDGRKFEMLLGEKEKLIYLDHKIRGCIHVLIRSAAGDCYVVLSRFRKKKVPFITARYLSNIDIFESCINSVLIKILIKTKAAYMQIDERLLKKRMIRNSFRVKAHCEKLFISCSVDPVDIDNLYSELVLLDI